MIVPNNICIKSKKEQNQTYKKILSAGYSFEFEENGVSIMKDGKAVYSFSTWVTKAPIISKLIWFGVYELYKERFGK